MTRTGRVFNPYVPWAAEAMAPNTLPSPQTLDALFTGLSIDGPIQKAYDRDNARAAQDACDCEEADLSPPPSPFAVFYSDSPLSTPPNSPLSTPPNSPPLSPAASSSLPAFPLFIPALPGSGSLSKRSKTGKAARQAQKRANACASQGLYKARSSLSKKWRLSTIIRTEVSLSTLRIAHGAYVGKRLDPSHGTPYTVEDLKARGFRLVQWDGVTPTALVEKGRRLAVMLAGRPKDKDWDAVVEAATKMLLNAEGQFKRRKQEAKHRRGTYAFLGTGVSFGGGQTFPSNLHNPIWKQKILDRLLASKAFQRIAGFGNGESAGSLTTLKPLMLCLYV